MAPKAKRRADSDDEHVNDWAPATKVSNVGQGSSSSGTSLDRKAKFKLHLTALNNQFADWVQSQRASHLHELWVPGVKDYQAHAEQLLKDFKDVIDTELQQPSSTTDKQQTAGAGAAGGWFGAPASGAASFGAASTGAANGDKAAPEQPLSGPAAFNFPAAAPSPNASPAPASGALFGFGSSQPAASSSAAANTSNAAPATGFNFGNGSTNASTAAPTTGFSFGSGSTAPATGTAGAGFAFGGFKAAQPAAGADAAKPADDGSGSSASAGTAGGGLFSFGGGSSALPAPSFGAAPGGFFSFGAPAENGGGAAAAAAAGGEEEGAEEEPQKYESAVETNEEAGTIHFKAKAKLSHLKNGAWDPKGLGQLMLRTRTDQQAKPFITFTTEAGRVLYCANVHKSMKVIVNEARNSTTWGAVWAPEADSAPTLHTVMAQLPKGKAAEFKAEVERLQAGMP